MKGSNPSTNAQYQKGTKQKKIESFPAYEIVLAKGSVLFKSLASEDAASTDPLHRSRPMLRVRPSMVAKLVQSLCKACAKLEQNQKGNRWE